MGLPKDGPTADPYEVALQAANSERNEVRAKQHENRLEAARLEKRLQEIDILINALEARVGAGKKAATRATPVYGNVYELFKANPSPDKEWTPPEVYKALTEKGVYADPKQISNVMNYLEDRGRLQRVGRGKYVIRDLGAGLLTDQPIPGMEEPIEDE